MTKRPSVMSLDDLMRPEPAPVEVAAPEPATEPAAPVVEPETAITAEPEPEPDTPVKAGRKPVSDVFRTSLYFHRSVHDALRAIAYEERATVSDLINEGLDMVLKARGYPSAADLKAKGLPKRKRASAR